MLPDGPTSETGTDLGVKKKNSHSLIFVPGTECLPLISLLVFLFTYSNQM